MHFKYEDRNRLNIRVEKKAYAILTLVKKKKKAAVSTSTSDKEDFRTKSTIRDEEHNFIKIKGQSLRRT